MRTGPALPAAAASGTAAPPARPLAPEAARDAAARRYATCDGTPAAFGFGAGPDRPGTWFCHAHRADGQRRAA